VGNLRHNTAQNSVIYKSHQQFLVKNRDCNGHVAEMLQQKCKQIFGGEITWKVAG
jgi:hypothetical protein